MADTPPYPGTPRWVKVFGIILVVLLLMAITMVIGGGDHGRQASSGGPVQTPALEREVK